MSLIVRPGTLCVFDHSRRKLSWKWWRRVKILMWYHRTFFWTNRRPVIISDCSFYLWFYWFCSYFYIYVILTSLFIRLNSLFFERIIYCFDEAFIDEIWTTKISRPANVELDLRNSIRYAAINHLLMILHIEKFTRSSS